MTSAYDYDCDGCLRTLAQVPLEAAIAPSTCLHHLTSGFYRTVSVPVWNFPFAAVGGRRRKKRRRKRKKRAPAQKHGQRSERSMTMTSRFGRLPQMRQKRLHVSLHSSLGPLFGAAPEYILVEHHGTKWCTKHECENHRCAMKCRCAMTSWNMWDHVLPQRVGQCGMFLKPEKQV